MSSREAFEQWWAEAGKCGWRTEEKFAFEAWQAATERAAAVCQAEMDEQFCDSDPWYAARTCRDAIREGNDG